MADSKHHWVLTQQNESGGSTDSGLGDFSGGNQQDVYICHGKADTEAASDLYLALKKDCPGIKVFLERECVAWGQPVLSSVQANLVLARMAVVLVSEKSLDALNNRLDLDSLLNRQIKEEMPLIRPVLVGEVNMTRFSKKMPYIANLKPMKVSAEDGLDRFDTLCRGIQAHLSVIDHTFRQRSISMGVSDVPPISAHCDREDESFELIEWVEKRDGHSLLAFLNGFPGVGKSLLAKLVGHMAYDRGWRVHYADAKGMHSIPSLAEKIVDSLGFDGSSVKIGRAFQKVCHGNKKLLLILDDCDRLIREATSGFLDFLGKILQRQHFRKLKVMVTSRIRCQQIRFEAKEVTVNPLNDAGKVKRWLAQRCVGITDGEASYLEKCSFGHPMLLNHFVQMLKSKRVSSKRLCSNFSGSLSQDGPWNLLEQHLSASTDRIDYLLKDCIAALKPEMVVKAACLAVFPASFSLEAGETIADAATINCLADQSLLESLSNCQLKMDPLPRSYLRQLAKKKYCDEFCKAKVAFYRFYINQLKEIRKKFFCGNADSALADFDEDKHNYDSILKSDIVPRELHKEYMDMVLRLNFFLKFRWSNVDLLKLYNKCTDLAHSRSQMTVKAWLQIMCADTYVCQGKATDAIRELDDAKRFFETSSTDSCTLALACCHATLGNAQRCLGNLEEALVNLQKSEELYDTNPSLGNDGGKECLVSVLRALGATYADLSFQIGAQEMASTYLRKALDHYKKAREICRANLGQQREAGRGRTCNLGLKNFLLGVHPYTASIEFHIAELNDLDGMHGEALARLSEVTQIQEKLKVDVVPQARTLYSRGAIMYRSGDEEAGIECMEKALSVSLERDLMHFLIAFMLGKIYCKRGELGRAVSMFSEAVAAADEIHYVGDLYVEALSYGCIAAKQVQSESTASGFQEKLRKIPQQSECEGRKTLVASALGLPTGSRIPVPEVKFCCWFYSQFCWHHQCLAKACCSSGPSESFPFSDFGRKSDLKLALDVDRSLVNLAASMELDTPLSPPSTLGLIEGISEGSIDSGKDVAFRERMSSRTSRTSSLGLTDSPKSRWSDSPVFSSKFTSWGSNEGSKEELHQMGGEGHISRPRLGTIT